MIEAPVGVEVTRADVVESRHRVHAVVADAQGNVLWSTGDPDLVTFLRSGAKPFQALPLVASGAADRFALASEELALACGSHQGEPEHAAAAAGILAKAGLDASVLVCGTHAPRSQRSRDGLAGGSPTPLHHNCSGNHSGLALLQKHLVGDATDYWRADSAAQRESLDAVARIAGVAPASVQTAPDGCGIPSYALPLRAAATMFARLALPQRVAKADADALSRIARAMTAFPERVGGTESFDTDLMGASEDRLVSKAGAEGFQGVGDLASGLGLALKVEDGDAAKRATSAATVEALRQLGWLESRAFEVLGDWWRPPVRAFSGRVVGEARPVLQMRQA